MADAVTSTTIVDDNRKAVIQLTNTSDGTGESAVTKIDVSALAARKGDGATCTGCKLANHLLNLWYECKTTLERQYKHYMLGFKF